jgi:hypothetical protein
MRMSRFHRTLFTPMSALTSSDWSQAGSRTIRSSCWLAQVKRIWGKKLRLTAAGVHALRDEYTGTIEPARALAAGTLKLERTLSDLVNQAYGLTPAEIELLWKTAPPRMPIPPPTK